VWSGHEPTTVCCYRQRKAALREHAPTRGEPAAILFAADRVANVREYSEQLARSRRRRQSPRRDDCSTTPSLVEA
jgi:hypothetical protein